jgi:hypothetical protein
MMDTQFMARALLAAAALLQIVACTGHIVPPTPTKPPVVANNIDRACPAMIPDQNTSICPRLKNITLSCGGNGMLHTSVNGGSGKPILLGAKLDDGSVLSAVLVVFNCQDGPREGVTFGVSYTGQVRIPSNANAPPCISQSKAVYSQFQFGNPLYAVFEGLAKDKLHQTFDEQAINNFANTFGLAMPPMPRCSSWREMP